MGSVPSSTSCCSAVTTVDAVGWNSYSDSTTTEFHVFDTYADPYEQLGRSGCA